MDKSCIKRITELESKVTRQQDDGLTIDDFYSSPERLSVTGKRFVLADFYEQGKIL